MITLDGLPILVDRDFQLRDFLSARLPADHILFARHAERRLHANPFSCDNAPNYLESPYPELPPIKVGELQWPSGASRYARALYAVDWETLKVLAESAWGYAPETEPTDVPAEWGNTFYEVTLSIQGEAEAFTADMLMLRPIRITGQGIGAWLLPLVDDRFKMMHTAHEPGSNPETMAATLNALATSAGTVITVDTPSISGNPDPRIWKAEQPATLLLDAAALSCGLRIVRSPSGELRAISVGTSGTRRNARLTNAWELVSGGLRGDTELPPSIRVHCRLKDHEEFEVFSQSVTGGMNPGGEPLAIWSSWLAENDTDVDAIAFAGELADSIEDWANCGGQYAKPGAEAYTPSGFDDYLSIIQEELPSGEYAFVSRFYELPGVFLPRAILLNGRKDCNPPIHFLFTLDGDMGTSSGTAEIVEMNDLVTVEASATVVNTLGDFSDLLDGDRGICVKVDGAYYAIHPDGGGSSTSRTEGVIFTLYEGLDGTSTSTALATVIDSSVSGLSPGDQITVRNTGEKHAYTGSMGHAIEVDKGSGEWWISEIEQVSILSEVTLSSRTHVWTSGSFSGVTRYGNTQSTITTSSFEPVYDWPLTYLPSPRPTITNPYNLVGESGDKALVVYDATADEFQLVRIYHSIAKKIVFELATDWPNGLFQTKTDGIIVMPFPGESGTIAGSVTLRDSFNNAHNAKVGHIGQAVWNYSTEEYDITECQHQATHCIGTIASTFSSAPATFTVDVTSTGYMDGFDPTSVSGELTVQNRYSWEAGTAGAEIEIFRDPHNGNWYPRQMEYDCA